MDRPNNRQSHKKESLSARGNPQVRLSSISTGIFTSPSRKGSTIVRSSQSAINQTPRPSFGQQRRSLTSGVSLRSSRGLQSGRSYLNKKSSKNLSKNASNASWDSGHCGTLTRLPRKIRLLIWNRLRLADQLKLRLVCPLVKNDIDHFIGVKVELDDVDESFPYLRKLGIKSAIILDIPSITGRFLVHPELLKELTILGGIRTSCFIIIMKECTNIVHLVIQFSKDVMVTRPRLFPVLINDKTQLNILPRLTSLEFQSSTKTDLELEYVKRNFFGLVNTHLLNRIYLFTLRVTIVHKFYHEIVEECSQLMSTLVHNNMEKLKDLEIDIKYLGTMALPEGENNAGNSEEDTDYVAPFFDHDDQSEDDKQPAWKLFTNLKNLHFSANPKDYQNYWKDMAHFICKLETLYLEIHSPLSWEIYRTFIAGCEPTLETVILDSAYYYDGNRRAKSIDLGVFKKCNNLESLFISQGRHHSIRNSKVRNISKLPRSIEDVEFEYLILAPCQVYSLLRSPHMNHLRIGYWSISDGSFGRLLCLLRWAYSCSCTSINELIIVDLKIRFQHNKKSLQVLMKRSLLQTEYTDFNETMLVIRRKESQ